MSVNLLLLYSSAMITAVIAKTTGDNGLASSTCIGLLVLFAVLTRVHGIRKPVV